MATDMWFRDDVARILASTRETVTNSLGAVPPLDPEKADVYHQGFADALQSVAVAFGLSSCTAEVTHGQERAPTAWHTKIVEMDQMPRTALRSQSTSKDRNNNGLS